MYFLSRKNSSIQFFRMMQIFIYAIWSSTIILHFFHSLFSKMGEFVICSVTQANLWYINDIVSGRTIMHYSYPQIRGLYRSEGVVSMLGVSARLIGSVLRFLKLWDLCDFHYVLLNW